MREGSNTTRSTPLILAALAALLVPLLPARTEAQIPHGVSMRDNVFQPKEIRIDPGDSVNWSNQGSRVHAVQSDPSADNARFRSPDMAPGDSYSQTFPNQGYYIYFCRFHGSQGRVGMWGVVIVGDAVPPPNLEVEKDIRPKLIVPRDFPTIQKAVDAASPGSTVQIKPGTYYEDVVITTDNLIVQGVDRFRTVLHGRDKMSNGITVDGARNVTVRNLTVRNYLGNGVFINKSRDYAVVRVDAIKGRTYGIYAFDSYNGVFRNSYAHGSGDGGFYVGQCLGCGALLDNLKAEYNFLGYSGTNATGVTIRDSVWQNNAVGIVPNTLPTEELGPNRGTVVMGNLVRNNNYTGIPPAGFSETGYAHGIGIWLAGTQNNIARDNRVEDHDTIGILVSVFIGADAAPVNNEVRNNVVRNSGVYDLAWDGLGPNNCFSGNDFDGATGPPMIQSLFGCERRPFVGVPYPPTLLAVGAVIAEDQDRDISEPPDPNRPSCQKGRPGCKR